MNLEIVNICPTPAYETNLMGSWIWFSKILQKDKEFCMILERLLIITTIILNIAIEQGEYGYSCQLRYDELTNK